jgi:hypothetical protein
VVIELLDWIGLETEIEVLETSTNLPESEREINPRGFVSETGFDAAPIDHVQEEDRATMRKIVKLVLER